MKNEHELGKRQRKTEGDKRLKKAGGGLEMYDKEDYSNKRIVNLLKEIRTGINITGWMVMILLLIKVIEYFE